MMKGEVVFNNRYVTPKSKCRAPKSRCCKVKKRRRLTECMDRACMLYKFLVFLVTLGVISYYIGSSYPATFNRIFGMPCGNVSDISTTPEN